MKLASKNFFLHNFSTNRKSTKSAIKNFLPSCFSAFRDISFYFNSIIFFSIRIFHFNWLIADSFTNSNRGMHLSDITLPIFKRNFRSSKVYYIIRFINIICCSNTRNNALFLFNHVDWERKIKLVHTVSYSILYYFNTRKLCNSVYC